MRVLQLPFKLLTISGIWRPIDWDDKKYKFLWIPFSLICNGLIFLVDTYLFVRILQSKSIAQFSERLFLVPTGLSCLQKSFVFNFHRKKFIKLADMLLSSYCLPRNKEEMDIKFKYDEIIRFLV